MGRSANIDTWRKVGEQTYMLPTNPYRLNAGLIVGTSRAMVIDTGAGPNHAKAILAAVRAKTNLPLIVVNTHAHFDHFFGNAVFAEHGTDEFWAHERCAAAIAVSGEDQRSQVSEREPQMAAGRGSGSALVPPTHLVPDQGGLIDLGGREVELLHLGFGHTDHDLSVGADTVLFTGDLIEEGADPAFEDAYPAEWVATINRLIHLRDRYEVYIPGHGAPVGEHFLRVQADMLAQAIRIAEQARREAPGDATKTIPILPYGPEQARVLLDRLRDGG